MSSRVPKEACRVRAAGFSNYLRSKQGKRKGARMGFPSWRKRKHGSRFRYDADRAKPSMPAPCACPPSVRWPPARTCPGSSTA